ncbi:TadE/TadG family type IV pilus assembly protein [Roseibium algae]|uniref:TadE/TadG family type IV pilus assembly protein n=1 Tax=Roseibium algae TaxID=3123038 RepID=A0ABU8TL80_9HYPH
MLMALACRFKLICRKFRNDVAGAVLPIFALMSVLILVIAGSGIDYARAVNAKQVMANAMDAASLAVASQLSTTVMDDDEISKMLKEVFEANLSSLNLKKLAVTNLEFAVDPNEGLIKVSSTISVPTYFIGIGGIGPDHLDVDVNSEVTYSKFDVELTLVLDVTGSMGKDENDIKALRKASSDLVNVLLPEDIPESDSKVRISVVPYSQGVNLGSDAALVSNGTAEDNCVTERGGDGQFKDLPYNYGSDVEGDDPTVTTFFGGGDTKCPPVNPLMPLTSDRDDLLEAIKKLQADNGTAGQVGIAWGWYTLSPDWTNLWPSDSDPAPYSDDDVLKFAVIMTDGDFNEHYDYVEDTNPWTQDCTNGHYETEEYSYWSWRYRRMVKGTKQVWVEDCVSRYYWDETYLWKSTYDDPPAVRARAICDAMKEKEIEIFSIYFDTGIVGYGPKLMDYCASDEDNYYEATSPENLIEAFGNIAKKIQAIYLSK